MSEITLKNVSKIYENQQYAVRNVNLEIQDKEFVILVGPSGCGKSTTLRMGNLVIIVNQRTEKCLWCFRITLFIPI